MIYMCSEKLTLEGQQLTRLEKPMESENQEALEEDEALRVNEEDAEPISDDEEIEEIEYFDTELEEPCRPELLTGTDRSSMHSQTYDMERQESMEEDDSVEGDEADLLPPPIIQLSERSQKRSSGRVTMPSSRLRGYKVY